MSSSSSATSRKVIKWPVANGAAPAESVLPGHSQASTAMPAHTHDRPESQFMETASLRQSMESLHTHPHIDRLLAQLWEKDPDTYRHCHRVADLAQALAGELGMSAPERVEVYLSGLLHDIGKLLTPDVVLKKPGPLTQDEFAIMRLHPEDSGKIVASISDIAHLSPAIRGHHERIDGKGYPDGLQKSSVPQLSRIVLVADTFDAMMNNRVYRKRLDIERTYAEIVRCSGTQFDPDAAHAFIAMHQRVVGEAEKTADKNKQVA